MLLTDLWTISISLKTILCEAGSQCSSFKIDPGSQCLDELVHNDLCISSKYANQEIIFHSKNSRVRFDPEKSPRGPDPFWGQTYPESRSDWPGIRVRLTQNPSQKDIMDSDSGNFYRDSRSVWPRNGSGPMGPFSGSNLTREFLECTKDMYMALYAWGTHLVSMTINFGITSRWWFHCKPKSVALLSRFTMQLPKPYLTILIITNSSSITTNTIQYKPGVSTELYHCAATLFFFSANPRNFISNAEGRVQ